MTTEDANISTQRELRFEAKTVEQLEQSYMPFLNGKGLFVSTKETFNLDEPVTLTAKLFDTSEEFTIQTRVAWITPDNAQEGKESGVGLQFITEDNHDFLALINNSLASADNIEVISDTL